jgi:hypothetical protein
MPWLVHLSQPGHAGQKVAVPQRICLKKKWKFSGGVNLLFLYLELSASDNQSLPF